MVMVVVAEATYLSPDIRGPAAVETSTITSTNTDTDPAVMTVQRLNVDWPHMHWPRER